MRTRQTEGHTQKDHHRAGSLLEADRWVEHLESENDANLAEDLEILLKNSSADEAILASLERTRKAVKASDDVAMPESGLYYKDLHDKIMAAIDFEEIPETRRAKYDVSHQVKARRYTSAWQGMWGAAGMAMMVALVSWVGLRDSGTNTSVATPTIASVEASANSDQANLERSIANVSVSYSDDVNGFESEQEIVEEAAIQKLSQLSDEQVDELYRSLRQ